MFSIDGIQWDFPCDIDRVAEVRPSEISGMLLDKSYFNDVIGTYLKYTVTMVVPIGRMDDYARVYEAITDPVDAHSFVLPYGSGTITVTGRVSNLSDVYKRMANGGVHWRGIKFDVISNHPTKTETLEGAITRGLAPLPNIGSAQAGQLYRFNGTEWELVSYMDADNIGY